MGLPVDEGVWSRPDHRHHGRMSDQLGDRPSLARRGTRPGWRDPRLALGVLVLAGSVVLGAVVLGQSDRTVPVWALTADVAAGQPLPADAYEERRVRFADAALADQYLSAQEAPPADAVLLRPVGAGELLPRAALGTPEDAGDVVEVPVAAAVDAVPSTVRSGSVVDVWVTASGDDTGAQRVLDDVVVIEAPAASEGFTPAGTRRLVLAVPTDQADTALPRLLAAAGGTGVVVTREP